MNVIQRADARIEMRIPKELKFNLEKEANKMKMTLSKYVLLILSERKKKNEHSSDS